MVKKSGFTLVELLVVIAIIGVLIALLLPAVQQARESARRMQCSNNLKQLSLALHNYHDVHQVFPPAALMPSSDRKGGASWLTRLLPQMEQNAAYDQMTFVDTDWTDQIGPNRNWQVTSTLRVPALNCPSSPMETTRKRATSAGTQALGAPTEIEYQVADYVGNGGSYFSGANVNQDVQPGEWGIYGYVTWNGTLVSIDEKNSQAIGFRDIVDGTSNTITIGEQSSFYNGPSCAAGNCDWRGGNWDGGAWSCGVGGWDEWWLNVATIRHGINWNGTGIGHNQPYYRHTIFRSQHPGGAQMARADGSVAFYAETTGLQTLMSLFDRADGAVIYND
ncbi:DUF1559 domain-containing protein [Blastopirellula retiformator]|uniref:Putative major pilin subunit n=1 Tax=Blastopirellula retiformator TaxID=2527970 RepID=A0A5C5UW82_9BACT|nr:DUF1559 domain-containing protein [Blastopirellula retiformator]TWT30616.1 putative major pilin subunit [Blastopirellula retiformator]